MMKTRKLPWIVLIVAAALLVGCSSTDIGITTKVKTQMAADATVRGYDIEVSTEKGVVTLTGNIDNEEAKSRALSIARETSGVADVRDMIAVRREDGTGDAPDPGRRVGIAIDDAGITLRVKDRLLDDALVKGLQIDVDTRRGVVYLTGKVRSEEEKEQAVKLARETEGVTEVQANLTIGKG